MKMRFILVLFLVVPLLTSIHSTHTGLNIPRWGEGILKWYSLFFPNNKTSSGVSPECTALVNVYQQVIKIVEIQGFLSTIIQVRSINIKLYFVKTRTKNYLKLLIKELILCYMIKFYIFASFDIKNLDYLI